MELSTQADPVINSFTTAVTIHIQLGQQELAKEVYKRVLTDFGSAPNELRNVMEQYRHTLAVIAANHSQQFSQFMREDPATLQAAGTTQAIHDSSSTVWAPGMLVYQKLALSDDEAELTASNIYLVAQSNLLLKHTTKHFAAKECCFMKLLRMEDRVRHHFPAVHSINRAESTSSCTMEYLPRGQDLREYFALNHDPAAIIAMLAQGIEILNALQQSATLHRDITPVNLFVATGTLILIDFSWASSAKGHCNEGAADKQPLPHKLGLHYRPSDPDSSFCDVYAMGQVFLEALDALTGANANANAIAIPKAVVDTLGAMTRDAVARETSPSVLLRMLHADAQAVDPPTGVPTAGGNGSMELQLLIIWPSFVSKKPAVEQAILQQLYTDIRLEFQIVSMHIRPAFPSADHTVAAMTDFYRASLIAAGNPDVKVNDLRGTQTHTAIWVACNDGYELRRESSGRFVQVNPRVFDFKQAWRQRFTAHGHLVLHATNNQAEVQVGGG
jgi:hypothetical protein